MMNRTHGPLSWKIRALLAAAWSLPCALILAVPLLASCSCHNVASLLYLGFSRICHQIPDRSFALLGCALPVCQRCSGIYAGLFLGCFAALPALNPGARARRLLVFGTIGALALDALIPLAGFWHGSASTRFVSGLAFGIVASQLVTRGLEEFAQEFSWRRFAPRSAQLKGDVV